MRSTRSLTLLLLLLVATVGAAAAPAAAARRRALRVDAGGHGVGPYRADTAVPGLTIAGGGFRHVTDERIRGRPSWLRRLYKTQYACVSCQYIFRVAPGTYKVRLHFIEVWRPSMRAGARVFNVAVSDLSFTRATIKGLDIFARVGARKPLVRTLRNIVVTDPGAPYYPVLSVGLTAVKDHAMVSAIELIPVKGGGFPCLKGGCTSE